MGHSPTNRFSSLLLRLGVGLSLMNKVSSLLLGLAWGFSPTNRFSSLLLRLGVGLSLMNKVSSLLLGLAWGLQPDKQVLVLAFEIRRGPRPDEQGFAFAFGISVGLQPHEPGSPRMGFSPGLSSDSSPCLECIFRPGKIEDDRHSSHRVICPHEKYQPS
jgi:hypothetical protein